MTSPVTDFLAQLTTPGFQKYIGEQLRAETAAASTFLSCRDEHEYPATGEVYEVSLTQPQTRRLLIEAIGA